MTATAFAVGAAPTVYFAIIGFVAATLSGAWHGGAGSSPVAFFWVAAPGHLVGRQIGDRRS